MKCLPRIQYSVKMSFINEDKVNFQKDTIGRTQLCMIVIKRNATGIFSCTENTQRKNHGDKREMS